MARKKRNPARSAAAATVTAGAVPSTVAGPSASSATAPLEGAGWIPVVLLATLMFLAPALGVTHEEMLQDTLKSMIVSLGALAAALAFFWEQWRRREPLRWHAVVWLPLGLAAYALGSMAWSHTYLAAVEAIRWVVFSLLVWLGLNTLSRERLPTLAAGIHLGALVASLWAALQFWFDFRLFPEGPPPASTFVNRNFFAEFAVCTLPFAAILLARARQSAQVALLSVSSAFIVVAILMTGTRAALIALWLQLLVVLPYAAWLYRGQLALGGWSRGTRWLAAGLLIATVAGLGVIPTGDPKIADEGRGMTALERGFKRTGSISASDPSLGIRMVMWKATAGMIRDRPLSGVGAGAWENAITLYQAEGAQLETDYYVHNEFLQLLAEYGIVGWLFLLALMAYLLDALRRTLTGRAPQQQAEGPWRAVLLCSLMSLMVVSNVGFPWRMASTGALFALCLGGLAASDARLGALAPWAASRIRWRPAMSQVALLIVAMAFVLAIYISQQAAQAEQKIVRATKLALSVSASANPRGRQWEPTKAEMLGLIREGIAINPHYRKITPMVADELARWGDWRDAIWIWESVLSSRPHIVAIMTNIARGYATLGQMDKALEYLARAEKVQPHAPSVLSLQVVLYGRTGQQEKALAIARQAIADKVYDYDLVNGTFVLAWRAGDYPLAAQAMELRMTGWPQTRTQGYLQLGNMYASGAKDREKALDAFRHALAMTPAGETEALLAEIPPEYRAALGLRGEAPAAAGQTSASKG
ncbi:MAG: O-antigen polymerase [Ramlibacter sp.]|nr:O-antigen polymerase [Ramlibacter sp.]